MKVAIVRLSSLGDIIFCMASLQMIRKRFPDAEITWVADARFADVLDYNPDIQRVIKLGLKGLKSRFNFSGFRKELDKVKGIGPFDIVIDMHGMLKSAMVSRLMGGPVSGLHPSTAKEPLATLAYHRKVRVPKEIIGVARYAKLAADALKFGFDDTELAGRTPFLFAGHDDRLSVKELFDDSLPNVILVAGSSTGYKNYPVESFAGVAAGLDVNVLVCHGNDQEEEAAGKIAQLATNVSLLPRLDINCLKAAIGMADLVIGGDTGPTHMAWGMNVPSIALFGATPSNCIIPTDRNRVILSGSALNYGKPDPNDFSVRNIPTAEVLLVAIELLQKFPKGNR
jgi:heptosyltransferase-1